MREFQKLPVPGFCSVLFAPITIDGEVRIEKLYCPVRPSTEDNPCPCGEWCVWYSEEKHTTSVEPFKRVLKTTVKCKGEILGVLKELEEKHI